MKGKGKVLCLSPTSAVNASFPATYSFASWAVKPPTPCEPHLSVPVCLCVSAVNELVVRMNQ